MSWAAGLGGARGDGLRRFYDSATGHMHVPAKNIALPPQVLAFFQRIIQAEDEQLLQVRVPPDLKRDCSEPPKAGWCCSCQGSSYTMHVCRFVPHPLMPNTSSFPLVRACHNIA